jgi:hypothetical protein
VTPRHAYRRIFGRGAILALSALLLAFASALWPGAAEAAQSAQSDGYFAAYPGGVTPLAVSGVITAGTCKYQQATDNPHLSSGDTSVHGWWLHYSGTCPAKATVTEYLQAYWCDIYGCRFITVSSGKADVYAGGGSGKRATARLACASSHTVGWRGFVDVNLDNWSDPSGYTYSAIENLACSPP